MKLGHGNMAKVISGPIVNNRITKSCDDSFLDIMKLGLILFVKIQMLNTSKKVYFTLSTFLVFRAIPTQSSL